jgi:hypothetical protein
MEKTVHETIAERFVDGTDYLAAWKSDKALRQEFADDFAAYCHFKHSEGLGLVKILQGQTKSLVLPGWRNGPRGRPWEVDQAPAVFPFLGSPAANARPMHCLQVSGGLNSKIQKGIQMTYLDEAKTILTDHTKSVQKRAAELRKAKKKLHDQRDQVVAERNTISESLTKRDYDPIRRQSAERAMVLVDKKLAEVKAERAKAVAELSAIQAGAIALLAATMGKAADDGFNSILAGAVRDVAALLDALDGLVDDTAGALGMDAGAVLPARQRIGFRRERLADFSKGLKL